MLLFTSRWPYSSLTRSGSSIDNISAAGSQSSKIISDFLFFPSSTDLQISDNEPNAHIYCQSHEKCEGDDNIYGSGFILLSYLLFDYHNKFDSNHIHFFSPS